jgi:hypothetical protein
LVLQVPIEIHTRSLEDLLFLQVQRAHLISNSCRFGLLILLLAQPVLIAHRMVGYPAADPESRSEAALDPGSFLRPGFVADDRIHFQYRQRVNLMFVPPALSSAR